jgi:hypothetical protein
MNYTRAALCAVLFLGTYRIRADDSDSYCPTAARASRCGWCRAWTRICLDRRIPALNRQWVCLVAGRWVRPPRAGVVWVQPRYVHTGSTWVFHKGYWR